MFITHRYIITDAGSELAHKLEVVAEQYENQSMTSPPPVDGRAPRIGGSSGSDSDSYRPINQSPPRYEMIYYQLPVKNDEQRYQGMGTSDDYNMR